MDPLDKITLNSVFPNPTSPTTRLYSEDEAASVQLEARKNLIRLIRATEPARIADEFVSVQPVNISIEDFNEACNIIAALHNLNHPDDLWPTSLVAKHKESK